MNRLHSNPFTFIKNMLLKDKFYIVFLLLFIPLLSIFSHYFKMFLHFGVGLVSIALDLVFLLQHSKASENTFLTFVNK